jgi:hypothetical protein
MFASVLCGAKVARNVRSASAASGEASAARATRIAGAPLT